MKLYVADGYGNHRVIVFDAETGKYKRHWGAYGNKPDDTDLGRYDPDAPPAQQFRNPVHCAELVDRRPVVCLRPRRTIASRCSRPTALSSRKFSSRRTRWAMARCGTSRSPRIRSRSTSIWRTASNEKVYVMQRETLEILTSFGDGGRQPGQFYAVHSIATDSKGNVFTTETTADSGSRSSCTRDWRGDQEGSGRRVAEEPRG